MKLKIFLICGHFLSFYGPKNDSKLWLFPKKWKLCIGCQFHGIARISWNWKIAMVEAMVEILGSGNRSKLNKFEKGALIGFFYIRHEVPDNADQ